MANRLKTEALSPKLPIPSTSEAVVSMMVITAVMEMVSMGMERRRRAGDMPA